MSLFLLFVLLLAAAVLVRYGWPRCGRALVGAVLALFLLIGCGPLPQWLMARWQAPYAVRPPLQWAPSNAIVLLTAGAVAVPGASVEPGQYAFGRITEAALLYRDCKRAGATCMLLVSGGDASWTGTPLALTYASTLGGLGVPARDMVLETHSMDTWQNARFSAPLLRRIGAQRVWLVTAGFHLRRAMLDFGDAGVAATPVRAEYFKVVPTLVPKAANFLIMDAVLHEWAGVTAFRLYRLSGRNPHAIPSWFAHAPRPPEEGV